MEHRATIDYHVAVTPSDEAFAWQVLTNYWKVWEDGLKDSSEDTSDEGGGSGEKGKVGPVRGFKNTAGKTVDKYHEYICLVGRSRKCPNAKLWSTTLRQAAQQEKARRDKAKQEEEAKDSIEETVVDDMYLDHDFMEYTQIDLEEAMKMAEAI